MSMDTIHDPIDFTFADLPARPGPCKAARAPETDRVSKVLADEVEDAPFIAQALGLA